MKQTAIILEIGGGKQLLVRLIGVHVPAGQIVVDARPDSYGTWQPEPADWREVRLEGE